MIDRIAHPRPGGRRLFLAAGLGAAAALLAASAPGSVADAPGFPAPLPTDRPAVTQEQIDAAVTKAANYLRGRIDPNGRARDEVPESDQFHGGRTALCAYALASAGSRGEDPALRRAMAWLAEANLRSVYAVSFRAAATALAGEPNSLPLLERDVRWLIGACSEGGQYTYESLGGRSADTFDNSNAHMAMVGVSAGASRGVEVPPEYWRRMESYWAGQQQIDGGWPYRTLARSRRAKTYGSMTAGGLESMLLCFDALHREEFAACREVPRYRPVEEGLAWLARNYSAQDNPGIGENRHFYWLWCLSRVARAGGFRAFGGHDWFAEAAAELVPRQGPAGSWGDGRDASETCFALLTLCGGRQTIAAGKLQYAGRWNARPRDLANFADWLSRSFERPVSWQIVDANAPLEDLCEAPVLYLSGAGPIELPDEQLQKLRAFVQRGGLIFSEAAGNNPEFTLDMQRMLRRLFPRYALQTLPADHPVYRAHFRPQVEAGLMGVSNGVRLLAVHAPREISLGLHLGATEQHQPWFELAANVVFQATDKAPIPPRDQRAWPVAAESAAGAPRLAVARLRHGGDDEPEPLAWARLSAKLARDGRLRLDVSPLMPPADLDVAKWPLAAITGTAEPNYTAEDLAAIRRYLQSGGTLIADAAGGSRVFGKWAENELLPLLPEAGVGALDLSADIFREPNVIARVHYRRGYAEAIGRRATEPGFIGVRTRDGRLAILYSSDDLVAALVGYGGYNIRGYAPASAEAVLTNVLLRAARQPSLAAPTSRP